MLRVKQAEAEAQAEDDEAAVNAAQQEVTNDEVAAKEATEQASEEGDLMQSSKKRSNQLVKRSGAKVS